MKERVNVFQEGKVSVAVKVSGERVGRDHFPDTVMMEVSKNEGRRTAGKEDGSWEIHAWKRMRKDERDSNNGKPEDDENTSSTR